jgi:uncharacterized membrane protein
MSRTGKANKKAQAAQKTKEKTFVSKKKVYVVLGAIVVLIMSIIIIFTIGFNTGKADTSETISGGLKILKSEVSETARFYPYKAGKTNMEVLAVKVSDGTIRTALNTCQVCFDSGRGYYKQQGNELICQNCGNRFKLDQIEKIRGGCNPVPILKGNKSEDDENIIISQAFLVENKGLFKNWRK